MKKVLFVCVHNAARSQMAEAFLNDLGQGVFVAESAGLEKGSINPYVVKVMAELGYDLSKNETNSAFDFYKEGRSYTYVIKVCDKTHGQRCPVFPQTLQVMEWDLEDPAAFEGTEEEILEKTRKVRGEIRQYVEEFVKNYGK